MNPTIDRTSSQEVSSSRSLMLAMKKTEELEKRLQESYAECNALQQQLITLRELYLKEQATLSQQKEALDEVQRQKQQLERVIHFLRSRAESAKLESIAVQRQFEDLTKQPQEAHVEEDSEKLHQIEQLIAHINQILHQ